MWKFKTDDKGNIVMGSDGKPIVIKPDGSEISYDIGVTMTTIGNLSNEAKTLRTEKTAAETKLAAFGDLDPEATKTALSKYKDVDLSKMVDAGKLEEVKTEINKIWEGKMAAKEKEFGSLQQNFHKTVKENAFAKSQFIKDKLIVPPDMVMAAFGQNFEVDDATGRIVAKINGQPLNSPNNPGAQATLDEAIEELVKTYPNRDAIMKGNNNSGSGATPGNGGNNGGKIVYRREDFSKLSAAEQMRIATVDVPGNKAVIQD